MKVELKYNKTNVTNLTGELHLMRLAKSFNDFQVMSVEKKLYYKRGRFRPIER